MTTTHDSVLRWLSTVRAPIIEELSSPLHLLDVPLSPPPQPTRKPTEEARTQGLKRRRRLLSPPMSAEACSDGHTREAQDEEDAYDDSDRQIDQDRPSKQRRLHDPDATPTRHTGLFGCAAVSTASSWSSALSATTTSSRSTTQSRKRRKLSPTKGLAALRIEHVIDKRSFGSKEPLPSSLKDMVRLIRRDAAGLGILSPPDLESITQSAEANTLVHDMLDTQPNLVDATGARQQLGALPDPTILNSIWEEAQCCELEGHSEASWNCAVHYPLLSAALGAAKGNGADSGQQLQVKVTNVTTAKVVKRYATSTAIAELDRRVDFCLCLKPQRTAASVAEALSQVAQSTQHFSVNHTDYTPVAANPITLNIETKRTGEDWQAALEQISTWMTSQWRCLDELGRSTNRNFPHASTSFDTLSQKDKVNLEFLPGIIIQGHDWIFVAATRGQGGATSEPQLQGERFEVLIWSKIFIGSTDTLQGIYQIVAVLQRLAAWSLDTYWPWFQQNILDKGH